MRGLIFAGLLRRGHWGRLSGCCGGRGPAVELLQMICWGGCAVGSWSLLRLGVVSDGFGGGIAGLCLVWAFLNIFSCHSINFCFPPAHFPPGLPFLPP